MQNTISCITLTDVKCHEFLFSARFALPGMSDFLSYTCAFALVLTPHHPVIGQLSYCVHLFCVKSSISLSIYTLLGLSIIAKSCRLFHAFLSLDLFYQISVFQTCSYIIVFNCGFSQDHFACLYVTHVGFTQTKPTLSLCTCVLLHLPAYLIKL